MKSRSLLPVLFLASSLGLSAASTPALTPESILAHQVSTIAASRESTKDKQKEVAQAVRFAVQAATQGITDPAVLLKIAIDFSTSAATAAPDYADAVIVGVMSIPLIADLPNAFSQISPAVQAAAKVVLFAPAGDDRGDQGDRGGNRGGNRGGGNEGGDHEFGGDTGDIVVSPSR